MTLPAYLSSLNLSAMPVDYEWNTVLFDTFWSVNDEDNPRLANALQLISGRAAFALGIACCEWIVARVEGHVDTRDALLRIEAAWAAVVDPRYAMLPVPPESPSSDIEQFTDPLWLVLKQIAYAHERWDDAAEVSSTTQGLAMLVDHIAGRHPAFEPWLANSLRLCHEHYPASDAPPEKEAPVPQELFNPDFTWSEDAASSALKHFLQALNPTMNLYLRSPEQMLATGFKGMPYGHASRREERR